MESFLSGGTDLLLTLIPLYLISEGISIKYIGLVLAVQRFSDLLGSLLAPKIKISYKSFFYLNYIISGLSLIFVFIIPSPMIKLILFSLSFIIIGISGNMFEKMIYSEYDYSKMGLIYSTNSSLYAFFAIVFITFLAGIYLILTKKLWRTLSVKSEVKNNLKVIQNPKKNNEIHIQIKSNAKLKGFENRNKGNR
ncbi:hypothetical protein [Streptococcus lutetiensis]|uniref:hypothetical protein n=1 Tax=Streptococcus lutetiensis TaxID=150055 RepID=UPI001F06C909|nr:hypothetical protein [Streptococcus lutetiensis]